MINGLNGNYQNIPIVDDTSSIKKYNTLDDLSLAYNSTKANNNDYYYNIKNSSSKIYAVSIVRNDASELFTRGKNLVDESKNGLFQSKIDSNKIKGGIENFVNSYNKFSSDIQNNDLDSNILKASSSALKRNEARLKSIGITISEDNILSIDKKKLNDAIENDTDKVKNIFSGYTGIGKKITSAANAVETNPNIIVQVNQNIGYNNNYAIMQSTAQQGSFLNLIR